MNLTELMRQHILESQQMDDICQIMEDIFIANSKNSRVFEYILEHGLSAEIETTYNDINYCIFVTPKPVEKQLYPQATTCCFEYLGKWRRIVSSDDWLRPISIIFC